MIDTQIQLVSRPPGVQWFAGTRHDVSDATHFVCALVSGLSSASGLAARPPKKIPSIRGDQ